MVRGGEGHFSNYDLTTDTTKISHSISAQLNSMLSNIFLTRKMLLSRIWVKIKSICTGQFSSGKYNFPIKNNWTFKAQAITFLYVRVV